MGSGSIQPIEEEEDHRERILQVYKKGADHSASGFQKDNEIREENRFPEFCSLFPEKREPVSPIGDCGKKRNWPGGFSESHETLHPRIFSPP
jgi:hypothetical protein